MVQCKLPGTSTGHQCYSIVELQGVFLSNSLVEWREENDQIKRENKSKSGQIKMC